MSSFSGSWWSWWQHSSHTSQSQCSQYLGSPPWFLTSFPWVTKTLVDEDLVEDERSGWGLWVNRPRRFLKHYWNYFLGTVTVLFMFYLFLLLPEYILWEVWIHLRLGLDQYDLKKLSYESKTVTVGTLTIVIMVIMVIIIVVTMFTMNIIKLFSVFKNQITATQSWCSERYGHFDNTCENIG